MHKRDIYEGEIFTSAESQSHHSAEIWARQNCFSCIFQIKWLGTAHKTPITEENWKEKQMRKHKNIEKFRLEGTPSCHLLQVFLQSRANYTGFSGPSLGFYCLPGWRFPILSLAQCLSVLLEIFLRRWASHSPTLVHCVLSYCCAPPGNVWLHLPILCHKAAEESRKITPSFCFFRRNKPSSPRPSLYIMFSRCPPILSAEPPHSQAFWIKDRQVQLDSDPLSNCALLERRTTSLRLLGHCQSSLSSKTLLHNQQFLKCSSLWIQSAHECGCQSTYKFLLIAVTATGTLLA